MKVTFRYYSWLLLIALALFFISFFIPSQTFDIHFHDTYFVFDAQYLIWFACILLLAAWLFYKVIHTYLFSKKLSYIHIWLTIISIVIILISLFIVQNSVIKVKPVDFSDWEKRSKLNVVNQVAAWSVLLLITTQVLIVLNLLLRIFSKKSNSS